MRFYELALVLVPTLEKETLEKLLAKIKKAVEDLGGKLEKEEEWGRKELAYRIKKEKEGLFFLWLLSLPPEKASLFEQQLKLEENLLRYLLVKTETPYQPSSRVHSENSLRGAQAEGTVRGKKGKGVKKEK